MQAAPDAAKSPAAKPSSAARPRDAAKSPAAKPSSAARPRDAAPSTATEPRAAAPRSATRAAAGPRAPAPRVAGASTPPPATRATRTFAQKRARHTHRLLLDAARAVFAERGFDEAQTPEIAERAGVAVGTFYRYFSDKRQAFLELVEEHLEDAYQRVMHNLTAEALGQGRAPRDRRATVDRVIEVLFRSTSESPKLDRVFIAMSMRDDAVARLRDEFEERGRQALAAVLRQVVSPSRIPDPEAAARVMQVAAQDVAFETAGLRGKPLSAREAAALRRALADMVYRYVFGED